MFIQITNDIMLKCRGNNYNIPKVEVTNMLKVNVNQLNRAIRDLNREIEKQVKKELQKLERELKRKLK